MDAVCFPAAAAAAAHVKVLAAAGYGGRQVKHSSLKVVRGAGGADWGRRGCLSTDLVTCRLLGCGSAAASFCSRRAGGKRWRKEAGSLVVRAGNGGKADAGERVLAAVSYFLPLLDGLQYGRYVFQQLPAAEALFYPLFPLLQVYKSIPYSNLIVFFTLYLGVVRNERMSRYVRFNAMQAVVLDVLLILPQVIERIVSPQGGVAFQILVLLYNSLFLFLVACFCFGVVSCLLGKTPRLPIVADAADAQV